MYAGSRVTGTLCQDWSGLVVYVGGTVTLCDMVVCVRMSVSPFQTFAVFVTSIQ